METIARFVTSRKSRSSLSVEDLVTERDRYLQEERDLSQQIQTIKNSMKYWNCGSTSPSDALAKEKSLKELETRRARLNSRLAMLGRQLTVADGECQLSSDEEEMDICGIASVGKISHAVQRTLILSS